MMQDIRGDIKMSINTINKCASGFIALSVLISAGLAAVPARADQPVTSYDIPSQYKQWMVGANSRGTITPAPGNYYNLKGLKNRKFFQYEKQGAGRGINLGWTNNATALTAKTKGKWFFHRPGGDKSPLVYGEPIAIAWYRGRSKSNYIRYASRTIGINLDWSKRPVFEWTIFGGKLGEPVRVGQDRVILYNKKHCRPMIYFNRTAGGDIGWPDSKRWNAGVITTGQRKVCF